MTIVLAGPSPGPIGVGYFIGFTSDVALVGDTAKCYVTKPGDALSVLTYGSTFFEFIPTIGVYLGHDRNGIVFSAVAINAYGQEPGTPVDLVITVEHAFAVVDTLTITGDYVHDPVTHMAAWFVRTLVESQTGLDRIYEAVINRLPSLP